MKKYLLAAVVMTVTLTSAQASGPFHRVRQAVQQRREVRHATACQFPQQSPPVMGANFPTPIRNVVVPTFQAVGSLVLPSRGTCANGVCETIPATNLPTGR